MVYNENSCVKFEFFCSDWSTIQKKKKWILTTLQILFDTINDNMFRVINTHKALVICKIQFAYKRKTPISIIYPKKFYFPAWMIMVSALCANDERTLNDIWWALVNGELDIRKERKRNCKVNGEHITWYVNAIWTLDKRSVRSVSRVIMFLCFVGNKKDQPINFL